MDLWEYWEQLMLVYLVYKYTYTENWEFIANELQFLRVKARPDSFPVAFTGQHCYVKFWELMFHYNPNPEVKDSLGSGLSDEIVVEQTMESVIHNLNHLVPVEVLRHVRKFVGESLYGERKVKKGRKRASNVVGKKDGETGRLTRILDFLDRNEHGAIFGSRLPSQMTEEYNKSIKEHMDLEMIRTKLGRGEYEECTALFFKDLFLICENAQAIFDEDSREFNAAIELEVMVSARMKNKDMFCVLALEAPRGRNE